MGRTKENGAAIGFVIIGIVLVGLLVGGIYFFRQQASTPDSPPVPVPEVPADVPAGELPGVPAAEEETPEDTAVVPQTSTSPRHLPQSGSVNTLLLLLAPAIFTGSMVAYLRSRRLLTSF